MRFGAPIWLVWRRSCFLPLYSSGGPIVESGGAATPPCRRYQSKGAIFEGWLADLFTREASWSARKTGDGRGPNWSWWEEPPHLALPPARRRGGYLGPGAFPMDKEAQTIRKGMAIPLPRVPEPSGLTSTDREDTNIQRRLASPGLKALGREYRFLVAAPSEELCLRPCR